ncbi:GTPase Era [Acetobacteroides hydrogenigenes]|uniref:GTPase Era n=1 Tax=Acetobacteroides hydrogenigenes TaxID=979970 RepID=A0A4R2E6Z9_9BACT|nr:GTPase Era [Acetobacteroides hydrogenigenes]TCN63721.1 GTP-binding protein Era [Acetobacteroides hydrogenigenes]
MAHKSGFVNILGNPNVGKSTLMNALVGERLSIITAKAQTTRHRIMGLVNTDDYQIVYSDTPGILKPNYKLQESMMTFVNTAITDADVFLYVTDVVETPDKNIEYIDRLKKTSTPIILIINKVDLSTQEKLEVLVEQWKERLPEAMIIPASAKLNFNLEAIMSNIVRLLPEAPPYFPKDQLTDKPMRFFAAEIIREKIFLNYEKEVPYCTEVVIESYVEDPKIVRIGAVIYVARQTQKGIIIGKQGSMLKKVGTEARKELEAFLGTKVFLEIFVKVSDKWRDNERDLKNFGYIQD